MRERANEFGLELEGREWWFPGWGTGTARGSQGWEGAGIRCRGHSLPTGWSGRRRPGPPLRQQEEKALGSTVSFCPLSMEEFGSCPHSFKAHRSCSPVSLWRSLPELISADHVMAQEAALMILRRKATQRPWCWLKPRIPQAAAELRVGASHTLPLLCAMSLFTTSEG